MRAYYLLDKSQNDEGLSGMCQTADAPAAAISETAQPNWFNSIQLRTELV
jgi:hypothetical protein